MKLKDTLTLASKSLAKDSIQHALIGGFALAAYGVSRATIDIDFLVDGDNADLFNEWNAIEEIRSKL